MVRSNHKIAAVLLILLPLALQESAFVSAATVYQPTWESVDQHTPAPEWFKDAKFGIYFHWGVFSVPAYRSEWYPRWMYLAGSTESNHHIATYGNTTSWPYNKFITGGRALNGDTVQFNPRLKSLGGNFDPNEWAQLFADAGAQFAGPVMEHHDGYSMWNSTVNEWNSVSTGPHLDLAKLLTDAIRAKGLRVLSAMHHAYNFNGFYQYAPTPADSSLKKLFGKLTDDQENQLWYDKLKEVIDGYQPDIIWQDFSLDQVNESQRLNFLSYYYNKAIDWNKEVVATYKDGFDLNGEVLDYERGGPGNLTPNYWLTDDAISATSWCYTAGISYYSTVQMLHSLIDRVSKNGNLLLNISPMANGTIPQAQKNILLGMGNWLNKFGECIYNTRAWTVYGQGPTKMGGGSFVSPKVGTAQDFRFTRSKDTTFLYAIMLGWPGNGVTVSIDSINSFNFKLDAQSKVYLIGDSAGTYISLAYTQDAAGLRVTMPSAQPYTALAYPLKISLLGPATLAIQNKNSNTVKNRGSGESYANGRLCFSSALHGSQIKVPEHAKGIAFYSLQGKKLYQCRFQGNERTFRFEDVNNIVAAKVFYIKFLSE